MSDCGSRTMHTAIHDHLLPGGTWPPNHLGVLAAEARQVEKKETGKVVVWMRGIPAPAEPQKSEICR